MNKKQELELLKRRISQHKEKIKKYGNDPLSEKMINELEHQYKSIERND